MASFRHGWRVDLLPPSQLLPQLLTKPIGEHTYRQRFYVFDAPVTHLFLPLTSCSLALARLSGCGSSILYRLMRMSQTFLALWSLHESTYHQNATQPSDPTRCAESACGMPGLSLLLSSTRSLYLKRATVGNKSHDPFTIRHSFILR